MWPHIIKIAHNTSLLRTGNITYLGINISPKLSELFNLNYMPLLKKIEDDIQRWINLSLSLTGRIATVKIKTLQQINYLFSMLPITPTDKWFKSLDSLTSHSILLECVICFLCLSEYRHQPIPALHIACTA